MISTGICRWLFLLISLSTWTKLIDAKEMRIVCYYTNWSVYRPGQAKFSPQNINPYLCTHLVYAFGGFTKENTLKPFDKYQDIEKGGYAKFTGLKTYNKNLKTLIAIGGWNEGSSRFSPMVASAERRKELVKNAIKFLRQNHFDGLDLDWEYPTFRDGGKPRDRDNYAQLVQELREEFERESEKTGRPRLLLTMAVPAGIEYINKGYDVPKLTKYLDWMNILSYDYHSAFEPAVNHHAPLFSLEEDNEYNYDAELNIDYTIKHYLKMGADPAKLVLGIPTYGRSYTLFNPDAFEIGSPADGPGDMGEATRENGYLAYYEICDYVKNQDWEVDEPNPKAMGPIAFKDNQWVGYDDENIVRKKAEYVVENGLGGIMFWAIDNDDFRGNCHGKPYPLIEAGKEAMLNAYGVNEDNLISPPSKPTKTSKLKNRRKTTTTTEKPQVSTTPRRRRIKTKSPKSEETSTYSSLKIVTPAYTTPEPPATPDMGGAFKCEDEGFFPHPKDCKKYYWCLSGAGDSGIVAHQFTCPAGLYFNKAADSCDYSQNVFCNKKAQKATTEKTQATTTTRPPPKITAATSKTTLNFRTTTTTTTTEAPEEEEYEYEEEEEEPSKKVTSEEDPKVIKELIDLIRKAGGIEELEKQLKLGKDTTTSNEGSTTPSSISKSLFERVLSKTNKNTFSALRTAGNRNSGGPQSFGGEAKEKKVERGRPQYRTLTRQRSTTEAPATEPQEKETKSRTSLEYVNIRRPKTSSTTEANEEDNGLSRNKILGELDAEENRDVEESEPITKRPNQPQYVNIRRQRPTTTEATSTSSRYTSLRRSTAPPVDQEEETELNEPSGTTEASSSTSASLRYQTIRRGSVTTTTTPTTTETTRRRSTTTAPEDITTLRMTTSEATTDLVTTEDAEEVVSSSVKTDITSTQNTVTESNSSTVVPEAKKKRPLYQPRPFSAVATTTAATTTTTKTTSSRAAFRVGNRRRPTTFTRSESTTTPSPRVTKPGRRTTVPTSRRWSTYRPVESQGNTTTPLTRSTSRFRFVSRKPYGKTTPQPPLNTTDQYLDSTNHQTTENHSIKTSSELADIAVALQKVQRAPVPSRRKPQVSYTLVTPSPKKKTVAITLPFLQLYSTPGPFLNDVYNIQSISAQDFISKYSAGAASTRAGSRYTTSTNTPEVVITSGAVSKGRQPNQATHYRPVSDYDYYDNVESSVVGKIPAHSKVLLHDNGVIECLDQGNFPHPLSCKKFIYCAKMDTDKIIGWEYTCPKNLSFDPIGSMCNWSAGLGCNES